MRDFKGMKRQRGRNRNTGGGNKPQQHNANRAFDSNGPEGIKVRGNAQHVFEKYVQLARDATSAGDRVLGENYLQHAEHYFRVIRAVQPTRAVSDIVSRETFSSGYDIDFEDESGAQAYVEQPEPEVQQNDQNNGGNGGGGNNEQRQYDNNQNRNNNYNRDDRPRDNNQQNQNRDRDRDRNFRDRDDRPRDDRPRDNQQNQNRDDRPRDDRPRDDRPRDDRPRDDRPRDRDDRPRDRDRFRDRDRPREDRDPLAVVEPQATPLPRHDDAPVLRSSDGDASHAPAFLQPRTPRAPKPDVETAAPEAEAKPKPRRKAPAKTEEA